MKNRKMLKILVLIGIILNVLILKVNALGFTFTPTPSATTVKAKDTVKVSLKLSNIDAGELGINTFKSVLNYDENLFEDVKITSKNNWSITYNDNKSSEQYGTLLAVIVKPGVTEDQEIGEISFKVKSNTEGKKGDIVFKEVATNDGKESIVDTNKTLSINVEEKPGSPIGNVNTNTDGNGNSNSNSNGNKNTNANTSIVNNKQPSSTNKSDHSSLKIPFVGGREVASIIFGILVTITLGAAIITYIKYKKVK